MLCSFGAGSFFAISVHKEGQDDTSTAMAADDEDAFAPAQNIYSEFALCFQHFHKTLNPMSSAMYCGFLLDLDNVLENCYCHISY
jgi:hypothetical protein